MFIELTDHLRCTARHEESFLILLPDVMDGRLVHSGVLGCPVCQREVRVRDGMVDFGDSQAPSEPCALTVDAAHALLGLDGPGGYLALFGSAGSLAQDLSAQLRGIRMVLVNPPEGIVDSEAGSVLRSARSPLKARSMRGAVIPREFARDPEWLSGAISCVLPGLRVVGEGAAPERPELTILGEAGGWWVGRVSGKR